MYEDTPSLHITFQLQVSPLQAFLSLFGKSTVTLPCPMESVKYGWTPEREHLCEDKKPVPHQQSSCSSPAVMAWDTSYYNDEEDEELARKRRELQLIEEQIALKKASIALKKNNLQRTPQYCENDDEKEEEDEEWDNEIEVETEHEQSPLFTNNNFPQRSPHQEVVSLTERQISILNELTQPFVSFEVSRPVLPSHYQIHTTSSSV